MFRLSNKGLSLLEILVAMGVSSLIITAVYQLFHNQQQSYLVQNEVAQVQQGLRASLYLMTKDLRTAGFDPLTTGRFGFVTDFLPPDDILVDDINYAVDTNIIAFTIDDNEDGIVQANDSEQIVYRLNTETNQLEKFRWQRDGFSFRDWEPVSINVEALNFVYLDNAGNITNNPANFHSVEVTLLVRTRNEAKQYINTQIYTNKQNQNICPACADDKYRRRLFSTTVRLRNL
jgi:type IV pilus assembly protein PilW